MEGTMVWRRYGYGGDMGIEKEKGMESDMGIEGTWVWKG